MYVSVHTVAFYLRQIFRKLEIGSRVELARIVVERATARNRAVDRAHGHNPVRFGQGERMTVQLSHLDKVFFPDDGLTKGDLVSYYREMAPHILGYLRDRPLTLDRYPDGITGQRIVQKNAGKHFPDWVRRTEVPKQGGAVCHVLADRPTPWSTWPTRRRSSCTSSSAGWARSTGPTSSCSTSTRRPVTGSATSAVTRCTCARSSRTSSA